MGTSDSQNNSISQKSVIEGELWTVVAQKLIIFRWQLNIRTWNVDWKKKNFVVAAYYFF